MIFTNVVTLVLALAPVTLFAAPTQTVGSVQERGLVNKLLNALKDGSCDLKYAEMPTAPTPLPAPADGLVLTHVALGRGVQNYTCITGDPEAAPKAVGAIAQLFDASCSAVRGPALLAAEVAIALKHSIPTNKIAKHLVSGHHEFTSKGSPLFLLKSERADYGYVQGKLEASSKAPANASKGPNGLGSVPWLKLTATEGNYKEVYRLNTAGGVAPAKCGDLQGTFSVEYATEYWFWQESTE